MLAAMVEPVLDIVFVNPIQGGAQRPSMAPACGPGPCAGRFELAKSQFNRREVGRVRRQEQEAGPVFFHQFGEARGLAHAQVIVKPRFSEPPAAALHLVANWPLRWLASSRNWFS